MKLSNITNKKLKVKEGSFWGRDDMVAKMKKDEKESGMKKFVKIDDKGNHHGITTSDPDKWKELIADGWKEDKDYYNESKLVNEFADHDIKLLKAVARQIEADAHKGDYTAIDELLQNISTEELKAFLSDHRDMDEGGEGSGPKHKEVTVTKDGKSKVVKKIAAKVFTDAGWKVEESKKNCGCGKDPCETYGKKTEAVVEGTMIGGLMKYDGQPEGEYADAVARYKEFMSQPRPPSEEVTNMVQGFVFDDELLDRLGEAEDGGDVLDVRYIVQSRLEDFFGEDFKLEEGKYKSHAQRKAVHASKAEKLNEIDPSRSPWTQSGKHPGAMSRKELKREIAVFDELMARGDTLSPRELMQLDSLYGYLEGDNLAEEMVKEANRTIQKIQWKESRNK